jgi:hypothetical protein
VPFFQDNARLRVAARTMDTIQKLKWNVLPLPPYSPDLAPSDYHLFGSLKENVGGKFFRNNDEVIQDVQEWLHWQPKDFVLSGHPQASGSLAQVCHIPGRLCWKITISVLENKSNFYYVYKL